MDANTLSGLLSIILGVFIFILIILVVILVVLKFRDMSKKGEMKKNNDTVEYTIKFNLTKDENENWQVTEISQDDLEKIHGIYNYESE